MEPESLAEALNDVDKEYIDIITHDTDALATILEKISDNSTGSEITPPPNLLFNAFKLCSWKKLRVVIIGQDPYPTKGHAMGLCFSVNPGVAVPASLRNIYKCLEKQGLMVNTPTHGDISSWARQGVLMLNSALTTTVGDTGSHLSLWESYTDNIIKNICDTCAGEGRQLIFILWGSYAQKKEKIIRLSAKETKFQHSILSWGHPSPVSPFNQSDGPKNFINCTNFAECNDILEKLSADMIDWDPDCGI